MTWKRLAIAASAVEEAFTSLLLLAIVVLVFIAALTRYFGTPINWSVDVAQALFVWVIFVGAHQALRESRHIGVSLVVDRLHPNQRAAIRVVVGLLIAAFLVAIVVYGTQVSIINVRRILQNIPVSYSWVTMAAPVGALLMLATTLIRVGADVAALLESRRTGVAVDLLAPGREP
jgi:TRAP-type transport system small permease protein